MSLGKILEESTRTAVGIQAASYALACVGLNVQFGFTGLVNLGHVASLLMGAYGTAIVVDKGGPLWLGVVVGLLASVVLALVMGLPTLRLRADYLAIVTLSVAEILRIMVGTRSFRGLTNGQQGIQGFADGFFELNPIPRGRYGPPLDGLKFDERQLWLLLVCWSLVALTSLLVFAAMRSPWGRVLRAVREDEDAAKSLGKNVFAYKLQALVLGSVIGALAGVMLAFDRSFVEPKGFESAVTFIFLVIVILGGAGTVKGPWVGAMVYWFVFQFTDSFLRDVGWVDADVAAIRRLLAGVMLASLVIFRPQGLFGDRKESLIGER